MRRFEYLVRTIKYVLQQRFSDSSNTDRMAKDVVNNFEPSAIVDECGLKKKNDDRNENCSVISTAFVFVGETDVSRTSSVGSRLLTSFVKNNSLRFVANCRQWGEHWCSPYRFRFFPLRNNISTLRVRYLFCTLFVLRVRSSNT